MCPLYLPRGRICYPFLLSRSRVCRRLHLSRSSLWTTLTPAWTKSYPISSPNWSCSIPSQFTSTSRMAMNASYHHLLPVKIRRMGRVYFCPSTKYTTSDVMKFHTMAASDTIIRARNTRLMGMVTLICYWRRSRTIRRLHKSWVVSGMATFRMESFRWVNYSRFYPRTPQ